MFVDFGAGDTVAGVTSGGNNFDCLPDEDYPTGAAGAPAGQGGVLQQDPDADAIYAGAAAAAALPARSQPAFQVSPPTMDFGVEPTVKV